jgi:glutaredoxin 2
LDGIGEPVLNGPVRDDGAAWEGRITPKAARLTQPRYPLLGLPEFATVTALDHYTSRKRKTLGDLAELRANTSRHLSALMPDLEDLDRRIESPAAINGALSVDDVRVLPLLRSLAVVKELRFPHKVGEYFNTMMAKTGYRPLPAI